MLINTSECTLMRIMQIVRNVVFFRFKLKNCCCKILRVSDLVTHMFSKQICNCHFHENTFETGFFQQTFTWQDFKSFYFKSCFLNQILHFKSFYFKSCFLNQILHFQFMKSTVKPELTTSSK
jgi:hypothetical protein